MKSIREVRDWLLGNVVDEYGNLMLSDLDFSDFDGDVFTSGMRVKGDLFQSGHEVIGDLYQDSQEVMGDLYQRDQKVQGDYYCSDVKVKGDIITKEPTRLLKEITTEELAEMGYKLKGEKQNGQKKNI